MARNFGLTKRKVDKTTLVQVQTDGNYEAQLTRGWLKLLLNSGEEGLIKSDGGSTSYYELPEGATELNDLIEHKRMSFALGNIFKACYRLGQKDSADRLYDLNKIVYFANRLIQLEKKKNV